MLIGVLNAIKGSETMRKDHINISIPRELKAELNKLRIVDFEPPYSVIKRLVKAGKRENDE